MAEEDGQGSIKIMTNRRYKKSNLLFAILINVTLFFQQTFADDSNDHRKCPTCSNKLLLISFDGFRWDYLSKADTPNFDKIIKEGVYAENGIKNAFITKTLPNHYTIITGLYEESHGLVANDFFDPRLNETFSLHNHNQNLESKWFDNGGEPIWVTNQKGGVNRRSGVVMWPGNLARVKGYEASKFFPFDPAVSFETRIDLLMSWFTDHVPVNLGILYFEEPDSTGHFPGPETKEMNQMIQKLDDIVGLIMQKLEDAGLKNQINVIITSDHGMVERPTENRIDLDLYTDINTYQIFVTDPIANILPNSGMEDALIKNLSKIPHLTVYRKEDIPERYHYKHNVRIMPILLVADEGYSISHNKSITNPGNHGYDNNLSSMHPFFMATGPDFKSGFRTKKVFDNTDIYPLLCYLLGLDPAPNNGSLLNVVDLMNDKKKVSSQDSTFLIYIIVLLFIASVGGVFCVGACRQQRFLRRRQINLTSLSSGSGHTLYSPPSRTQYGSEVNSTDHKLPLLSSDSEGEF